MAAAEPTEAAKLVYPVPPAFAAQARLRRDDYDRLYAESLADPDGFWRHVADRLDWITPPTQVRDVSFDVEDFHIRWYADGVLNVSANCLDRHLPHRANDTAIIW